MSNEERASPLDLLRAGVTQGRQRVEVHNLKNEQSQLDKRRRQAVVELGELAWQERLTHPDYSSTFAELVKLERQRTALQSQLDELLTRISQQERLKEQLNEGFAARVDEVQAQKRAAAARLSKVMSSKLAAEQRLGEQQEPNSAEMERLSGEQQAIQSEISQYDAEMAAISDESRRTMRPIDEQLSQLQQQVRALKEQIAALASQMTPIMPVLGERVLTVRPVAAQLAEPYQQIDGLDRQLAQKANQMATLEQQIATASPTAKRVLYLLVGTVGTAILLLLVWFGVTLFGTSTQTYVNEAWGFSLEYPEEWHIVFAGDRVLIASDENWLEQWQDPDTSVPMGASIIQIGGEWHRAEKVPNLEAFSTDVMRLGTSSSNFKVVTPSEPVEINGYSGIHTEVINRELGSYNELSILNEGERAFFLSMNISTKSEEVPEIDSKLTDIIESFQIIEPAVKSYQHPTIGLSFVYPEDWTLEEIEGGVKMTSQAPFSYDGGRFNLDTISTDTGFLPSFQNQILVDRWINNGAQKVGEQRIEIGNNEPPHVQILKVKVAHLEDDQVDSEERDKEVYLTSAVFNVYTRMLGLFASCPVSTDSDICLEIEMIMDSLYQTRAVEQSSDGSSTPTVEGQPTAAVQGQPTAAVEGQPTATIEGQSTPTLSPTPSVFTLEVVLIEGERLPNELTVTLLELNQTLEFRAGADRIDNLPLGRYTVRVSAPGFEDNDYEVEARGDQLAPKRVLVQLGEPLPMDPNNMLLLADRRNTYNLTEITEEGITSHWNRQLNVDGWSSDFRRLKFHDSKGIGRIDIRGQVTREWTIPKEVQDTSSTQYRPDLQEIAYIQNNDIFTLATEEGAEPVRWSQVGLYENILGWFDKDTLLINTEPGGAQLVRRDGTNYQFLEWNISTDQLIFDSEGWLVFGHIFSYEAGGKIGVYQPGITESEVRFRVHARSSFYGWSPNNKYYLLHSGLDEAEPTSGLLAISQDGQLRQVAAQLLSPESNLVAWDLAPSGSQMALSWGAEEQAGIYIADAESQSIQRISDLVPNKLFWPTPDALVYVIEEGDNIGTWRLPLDGGQAQQLFAYRAENMTATPDGRLLLVANNTLWEYEGTGAPRILGEEGKTLVSDGYEFIWPQIEDATASSEATVVIPTISAETAALEATPTVVAEEEATAVALDTETIEATATLAAFETATSIVLVSDATPTAVSEATLVPPLETPTIVILDTATPVPPSETPTVVVFDTATPVPSSETPTVVIFDTATPVPPSETPTVVIFDTATPVPPSETPTVVIFDTATPLPPSETPTAEPTPTEAVEVVEAQEGTIPARVDLRGFEFIIVRDLDRSYAQVAIIDNTQTTFNAVARSPDGLWIYVSLQDGTTGWIASEYVVANQSLSLLPERVPVAAPQIAASIALSGYEFINVRAAPSLDAPVVTEIYDPNASFVAVGLSQDSQWVLVRLQDGTLGWTAREFVIGDQSLDDLPKRFYTVN